MKLQDKAFVMDLYAQHQNKLGAQVYYGSRNTYYLVLLNDEGKIVTSFCRVTRSFFKWFNVVELDGGAINVGIYRITDKIKTPEETRKEMNKLCRDI